MLFHIEYEFLAEVRKDAQDRFQETGAPPPEGVTMLGRWHTVQGRKGFMIAESDDPVALGKWTQQWTDLLTFQITPVVTDEQQLEVLG